MKLHLSKWGNIFTDEGGIFKVNGSASDESKQNTLELIKRWNLHDELVEALTNINELITHPSVEADETMPQIIAIQEILNKVKEGEL